MNGIHVRKANISNHQTKNQFTFRSKINTIVTLLKAFIIHLPIPYRRAQSIISRLCLTRNKIYNITTNFLYGTQKLRNWFEIRVILITIAIRTKNVEFVRFPWFYFSITISKSMKWNFRINWSVLRLSTAIYCVEVLSKHIVFHNWIRMWKW